MHILVTGGNGFIGRRVCEQSVRNDHDVTSVARSGPPDPDQRGEWAEDVHWVSADVFAPDEWRAELEDVDCVVHSIGTLSETPNAGVTFERINGDSAVIAALEAERASVDRFVYVSSSTRPPLVREAYLTARRRAERAIADLDMEIVVPRFGPVYGSDQPHFSTIANALFTVAGEVESVARWMGEDRPLPVERAGRAVYELAIADELPENPVTANTLLALS